MRPLAVLVLIPALALVGCSSSPAGADAALEEPRIDLPASVADRGDLAGRIDTVGRDAAKTDITAPREAAPGDLAPVADPCFPKPASGQHTLSCDGLSFQVSVPQVCLAPNKCGLIVDVHGLSMSGKMQEANTGLAALGLKHGYVVVQPNAPGNPPLSSWSAADDAKVHAFMLRVIKVFALDAKRVHVTGFSQGGAMTWRFICAHADLLASAAPAAACAVGGLQDACFTASAQPKVELPILYLHGTKDVLAGYGCAPTSIDAITKLWTLGAAQQIAGDGGYQHLRRTSAKGTVVEHLKHDYAAASPLLGGHCYPGSSDPGTVPGQLFPFGCIKPNAFVWGEQVVQFFLAHPKP